MKELETRLQTCRLMLLPHPLGDWEIGGRRYRFKGSVSENLPQRTLEDLQVNCLESAERYYATTKRHPEAALTVAIYISGEDSRIRTKIITESLIKSAHKLD